MGRESAVSLGLTQALADLRYLRLTGGNVTGQLLIGVPLVGFAGGVSISDGTPLGPNDDPIATIIGQLITRSSGAAGHITGFESVLRATTAGAGQAYDSIRGYAWANHTAGTVGTVRGLVSLVDIAGVGGTTNAGTAIEAQLFSSAGATLVTMRGLRIRNGTMAGTIGTLAMIDIEAPTAGGGGAPASNMAIRTAGGTVQIALPTSPAGLTSGQWWNNAGVPNIVP